MKAYRHIFFDLDRTIWDYERNAEEAILELIERHSLHKRGIEDPAAFVKSYCVINDRLWDDYGKDRITKEELRSQRFHLAFQEFGINDIVTANLVSDDFTALAPKKPHLLPGADEVLKYLNKKYSVHLITNGFEDTQKEKMKHSQISRYFKHMITSERSGFKKPDKRIFDYALRKTGAIAEGSIMIGDNYDLDILGAAGAGIDQVYYDPAGTGIDKSATHTVRSLNDLLGIL